MFFKSIDIARVARADASGADSVTGPTAVAFARMIEAIRADDFAAFKEAVTPETLARLTVLAAEAGVAVDASFHEMHKGLVDEGGPALRLGPSIILETEQGPRESIFHAVYTVPSDRPVGYAQFMKSAEGDKWQLNVNFAD